MTEFVRGSRAPTFFNPQLADSIAGDLYGLREAVVERYAGVCQAGFHVTGTLSGLPRNIENKLPGVCLAGFDTSLSGFDVDTRSMDTAGDEYKVRVTIRVYG